MLKLGCSIEIHSAQKWVFSAVSSVRIVQDIETLTDTCEIELPKKIKWQNLDNPFQIPLKRGDKVWVQLGYDGQLTTRFVGYIRRIDPKVPLRIYCEDSMFLLKLKKASPKSWRNARLQEVLTHLLQDTEIEFELVDKDIELGSYRIVKPTISEELQELKERYLLSSYFRIINGKNVLHIGLKYPQNNRKKHFFKQGVNIISHDLEYRNKDDIRARVRAESFGAKHKKTTIEIGDKDGDLIRIRIDGLTENQLKKYAEKTLENYKKDGLKGSFETFGTPAVDKCDILHITLENQNKGQYLVQKNEIQFSPNGYRQKIELGQSLH